MISFTNCRKAQSLNNHIPHITINLDKLSETSIDDFTDSIKIVSLETNDSCLLAFIFKIVKQNNLLYILDQKQNTLFCFDTNGKYHFKINNYGLGPNEYQSIEDFAVTENGYIYLLEPWGNVYCYDKEGKFKQKISLLDKLKSYNEIWATDSAFVFFSLWGQALYYPFNKENAEKIYELHPPMNIFCALNRTYTYQNKIRTISLFDANILEFSKDTLAVHLVCNFSNNNNTLNNINKLIQLLKDERYNANFDKTILDYVGSGKPLNQFIYRAFENDRYIFLLMDYKNSFLHVIYDKKEKESSIFKQTKENTTLHTGVFSDNTLIYYNRPFIKSDRNLNFLPPHILKAYEVNQNSEDNPLITIFYLKNNI